MAKKKAKKKKRLPQGFEVKHVPRTMPLFSRSFHKDKMPTESRPTWLAFEKGYGSAGSYGPYIFRHTLERKLRLLDVGKEAVRRAVGRWADKNTRRDMPPGACSNLPGDQVLDHAWGEGCSHPAAVLVCAVCRKLQLDGWLARDWDQEDMEGPEEVMLCDASLIKTSTLLAGPVRDVVDLT